MRINENSPRKWPNSHSQKFSCPPLDKFCLCNSQISHTGGCRIFRIQLENLTMGGFVRGVETSTQRRGRWGYIPQIFGVISSNIFYVSLAKVLTTQKHVLCKVQ